MLDWDQEQGHEATSVNMWFIHVKWQLKQPFLKQLNGQDLVLTQGLLNFKASNVVSPYWTDIASDMSSLCLRT